METTVFRVLKGQDVNAVARMMVDLHPGKRVLLHTKLLQGGEQEHEIVVTSHPRLFRATRVVRSG